MDNFLLRCPFHTKKSRFSKLTWPFDWLGNNLKITSEDCSFHLVQNSSLREMNVFVSNVRVFIIFNAMDFLFRVQKTPIKIEVQRVDKKTRKPEKIGYQTLDLRTHAIEVSKPRFTWLPLLGTQSFRVKPEIHIGVSVDDDLEAEENRKESPIAEVSRTARMYNSHTSPPIDRYSIRYKTFSNFFIFPILFFFCW